MNINNFFCGSFQVERAERLFQRIPSRQKWKIVCWRINFPSWLNALINSLTFMLLISYCTKMSQVQLSRTICREFTSRQPSVPTYRWLSQLRQLDAGNNTLHHLSPGHNVILRCQAAISLAPWRCFNHTVTEINNRFTKLVNVLAKDEDTKLHLYPCFFMLQ